NKHDGQIICFAGPPGVGKTSIAQSIAVAVGRKSQRIALGGVRDEAEIRGHRRTYIGSIPGRIISAIQSAGSNNPVLILDEIDKLASDYKGDPTSALLEVLDAEQNNKFCDHYIDIPFDLSNVMFITTANDVSAIPAPLRDRMEIIELDSYTREEKFNIAKKHLIPKQIIKCGFTAKEIKFNSSAIYCMIDFYTREAGVRTLERLIGKVLRKCAVKKLEDEVESFKITDKEIVEFLGHKKYLSDKLSAKDEIGVVNGLAWTSVGGELLPIEVAVMEGTGKLELTGSLGDVMRESAKAAITCIRSHASSLSVNSDFYKTMDMHIHAPEGAVPKDGPSAGITMATAIYSALSGKPVKRDVAMTGEITLRGKVMAIGGLKEKSMAAYKAGIKTVIIPKDNEPDLQDVDPVVKEKINFVPVSSFSQVLSVAIADVPVITDKQWNSVVGNETAKDTQSLRQ
ncbi:MAG: endopeptidase La, partial [Ruminococcus sp.]|nr:endopeptidase La [Ruminococcus sp.]